MKRFIWLMIIGVVTLIFTLALHHSTNAGSVPPVSQWGQWLPWPVDEFTTSVILLGLLLFGVIAMVGLAQQQPNQTAEVSLEPNSSVVYDLKKELAAILARQQDQELTLEGITRKLTTILESPDKTRRDES